MNSDNESMRTPARGVRLAVAVLLGAALAGGCGGDLSEQEYLDRGKQALDRGDYQSAVVDLKNVLRQNGSSAEGRWLLAKAYIALGNGEGAEKELKNARRLGVKQEAMIVELGSAYLMQGAFDRLLTELEVKSGMPVVMQHDIAVLRGYALLSLGRSKEAQASFRTALALRPDSANARIGLAKIYAANPADEEQRRQALQLIVDALSREPDNVEGLLAQGDLLRIGGDLDGAAAAFEHVLRLRKGNVLGLLGRAEVAIAREQYEAALQDLKAARAIRPGMVVVNYLSGLALFRTGQQAAAKEFLDVVLKAQPGHMPTLLLSGTINYNQNNLATAISQLASFVLANPQHVPARKLLAAAYLRLGQPDQAAQMLIPVIRIAAGDVQLFALLGRALLENRDFNGSVAAFQHALQLAPDNNGLRDQLALSALALGDVAQATRQVNVNLGLGKESLQLGAVQVLEAVMRKDTAAAITRARELVASYPREAFAQHLLGSMCVLGGRLPEARTAFKAALAIDPAFVQSLSDLGSVEIELGDLAAASDHLKEALSRQPNDVDAMMGLARIAGRKGAARQESDYLNSAFIKRPGDRQIGLALAASLRRQGDFAGATAVLRQLESRLPDDPGIVRANAEVLLAQQNYSGAAAAYRALTVKVPDDAAAWYALGKTLALQGQHDAARSAFDRVLALQPDNLPTLVALAESLILQSRYVEAQAMIARIQGRAPDDPVVDKLGGDIALRQQRYDDALTRYEAAYRRRPGSELVDPVLEGARLAGRRDVAIVTLRDWLTHTPDDHPRRLLLATLLSDRPDERSAAIREYERVIQAGAGGIPAKNNLALLYSEAGDARAVALADELRKQSDADFVLDTVGWIYVMQGDAGQGLQILQSVARRQPKNGAMQLHLARAYARMDRIPLAVSALESYLTIAPVDARERPEAERLLAGWRSGQGNARVQ